MCPLHLKSRPSVEQLTSETRASQADERNFREGTSPRDKSGQRKLPIMNAVPSPRRQRLVAARRNPRKRKNGSLVPIWGVMPAQLCRVYVQFLSRRSGITLAGFSQPSQMGIVVHTSASVIELSLADEAEGPGAVTRQSCHKQIRAEDHRDGPTIRSGTSLGAWSLARNFRGRTGAGACAPSKLFPPWGDIPLFLCIILYRCRRSPRLSRFNHCLCVGSKHSLVTYRNVR